MNAHDNYLGDLVSETLVHTFMMILAIDRILNIFEETNYLLVNDNYQGDSVNVRHKSAIFLIGAAGYGNFSVTSQNPNMNEQCQ